MKISKIFVCKNYTSLLSDSLPLLFSLALNQIMMLVDLYMVKHLGADATAIVGLAVNYSFIPHTIAIGLLTASLVLFSEKLNSNKILSVISVLFNGVLVAIFLALLSFILLYIMKLSLFHLNEIYKNTIDYLLIILLSFFFAFPSIVLNNLFLSIKKRNLLWV